MNKGGYQILDFKNINITDSLKVVIKGINDLLGNTKKPLLLTNVTINNVKNQDQFATYTDYDFDEGGTHYIYKEIILNPYSGDTPLTINIYPNDEVEFLLMGGA